jgi:hypothetical protein
VKISSLEEYEGLFREAEYQHKVIIDSSTRYIFSEEAISNIICYQKDAM